MKITQSQLKQIIKEELEAAFIQEELEEASSYARQSGGRYSPETGRQRRYSTSERGTPSRYAPPQKSPRQQVISQLEEFRARKNQAVRKCEAAGFDPEEIDMGDPYKRAPEHENVWCDDYIHVQRQIDQLDQRLKYMRESTTK
tara:strand:- start:2362 stop:2790 length:429 start_codon:yes stop_codon:yes gene_type:complete